MNHRFFGAIRLLAGILGFVGLALVGRAQATLPNATVGQAYSFTITTNPASPSGTIYGATGLPTGLSINSSSGTISGTPTVPGTSNGTLSLTSGVTTNNFSYTLTVLAATGTPAITSVAAATGTVGQSFVFTLTASNGPTSYNVGSLPAGLSFTNDVNNPTISGTPTAAGTYPITVSANNASGTGPSSTLTITINPPGPVPAITSATSDNAAINAAYTYTITASNTPTSYSAVGLPLGLSINTSTGAITGTPTVASVYTVALSASNSNGTGAVTNLTLTVGALSVITSTSLSATAGQAASLPLTATNSPVSFNVSGLPSGLTANTSTGVISGTPASAGTFTLTVSANNATGTGAASSVTLTVSAGGGGGGGGATAPSITAQPSNQTVTTGTGATFTVAAAGTAPITYQWKKGGVAIFGATSSSYTIAAAQTSDGGSYTVVVTNSAGSVTSTAATLSVLAIVTPVSITTQPVAQSGPLGGSASFTVAATGTGTITYQWLLNGAPIPGATGSTLTISNLPRGGSGNYSVIVTGASGSVTSNAVSLTVLSSRLINISARAFVGTGSQVLVAGYVVGGSGSKQSLIRAVGPTESQYGVSGALANPQLALYDASDLVIATNAGWGNASVRGPSAVQATLQPATTALFSQLYAFNLPAGSADSALVATLPAAAYTAQVSGVSGTTGVALAELYDADIGAPASRFVNISARAFVGTGSQVLVAGFVVSGPVPETVLIRGVGPTLSQYSVSGSLAAPQLTLFDSSTAVIATNTGWSSAPVSGSSTVQATVQGATASTFSQVYAFPLPAGSADCAMVVTLPPGSYTAQVSGLNNLTGVSLVEIYETQ